MCVWSLLVCFLCFVSCTCLDENSTLLFPLRRSRLNLICAPAYTVAWTNHPPLILTADGVIHGALHDILTTGVGHCCGPNTSLIFQDPFSSYGRVERDLDTEDFALPVSRRSSLSSVDSLISTWDYVPVIETPRAILLEPSDRSTSMLMESLLECWPLALLVASSAGIAAVIIWAIERSFNDTEFPVDFFRGHSDGLWWAFVTMTTVGYGDKTPHSLAGRGFGCIWITVGIAIMSIFTAALVTAFNSEFQMEDKLDGFKVGVMQDTEEHGTALLLGAQVAAYDDYDDLLHDLQFGVLEIAMVDVLFAVDVLGNLTDRQLVQGADIHRIYTHGFLIQDSVDKAVRSCVAKYAIQHRDVVNQHIMTKESKFQKKRDNRSGTTTRRLVRSEIFVVYVALSIWTILFVMGVIWQLVRNYMLKSKGSTPAGGTDPSPHSRENHQMQAISSYFRATGSGSPEG